MAVHYNTKIITNGLVLCLDAANRKSYPTTGTTWNDLSGRGNNGTLVNGPTFSSANGGSIVFDGVNDYATGGFSIISISTTITVSAWIIHNSLPSAIQRYLTVGSEVACIRYDGVNGSGQLHFFIKTSGSLKHIRLNNTLNINTWYNITGTWDGTTMRIYRNAVQIGSNIPGGTLDGGNLTYLLSAPSESMKGNISQASIYNRALTASEVQQNFNALRGRYGI